MTTDNILMAGENSGYRLTPGQKVLNRYTLGRILGRGGMGVVWLARDDALDLDVALKFVPSLVVNDRGILSDLKRETRRNLALTHPNIVRTYDFVQDETLAGISMEYVDADTLRNRRLDQPTGVFSPEELGEWTLQLCEALQYAHESAGIVHRDLKPANLLINARKQLKVADFGISRSLGESVTMVTGRNTSIGTLPYMSPQQLDGEPTHPLDDIYAIGATLYELCTSRPPFVSGEISRQILLKVPPTMTDRRAELGIAGGPLPQNWESTVAACLAKDRAARPQSAREIAVRLGLKEAGAARTTASKPLPITGKVAFKPLVPAAAPTVALPVPMDWRTRSLDTVRRSRRAALEASTIGLDTCRRGGRRALEASAAALERIKRDQRTAALASGIGLVALVLVLLGVRWLRGSHGDHPSAAQGVAASGKSAPGADRSGSHAGSLAPGGADVLSATAARGGIRIETDPPGASVQVDGAPAQKAPIVWNHLAAGQHTVSVALEGYDTFQTQVDVKANQTVDAPKIALARSGGTLDVTTDPPGADLIVRSTGPDATEFHSTSPWTSGKLPPGEYEVSATRPGWQPVVQRVSVTRDQAVPVDFKLTGGTVTINSSPAQATVLIDGKAVGVTPYTIQDAQPGELKYSLSLPGYGPTEVVGKVDAGQAVTLDAKMAAAVADGSKAGDGSKAAEDDDDDSAHAAKTAHSGDAHTTRHTTRTKKKTGNDGNEFLNALKKIPLPFWHH